MTSKSGILLKRLALSGFASLLLCAGAANADVVGIGTTKGGATATVSAGLASVVSTHSGHQMRPQPMGGTNQYIPIVNAGELEFGISNSMQAYMAISGTGLSEGSPNENLRLVSTLMTFRLGLLVRADSDIRSISDLRGKRLPSAFVASPLFAYLMDAHLANAGLDWDDVIAVPQPALRQHWDAFGQGEIDVAIAAIGSGTVKQLNAATGGVRFIGLFEDEKAIARMLALAPHTGTKTVSPAGPLVGVEEPIEVLTYAYLLWAHKDVSDDIVRDVAKSLYDNEAELKEASPLWKSHSSGTMAKSFGPEMPYHPGAIQLYKDVGVWND